MPDYGVRAISHVFFVNVGLFYVVPGSTVDTYSVQFWCFVGRISCIFHVTVNLDLEDVSCLALQCHGEVCTVDAPVALLSGVAWKSGHYVHEPVVSGSFCSPSGLYLSRVGGPVHRYMAQVTP